MSILVRTEARHGVSDTSRPALSRSRFPSAHKACRVQAPVIQDNVIGTVLQGGVKHQQLTRGNACISFSAVRLVGLVVIASGWGCVFTMDTQL